ncbi:hypothetical protein M514_02149 [Trichuris suis]|uniref:Uncharacterized protein n=1 Tax=Trichuris suis TaxID=68888 RepID=A0A085MI46_9BILA|nr:hypothetical protein M513_02149 [Trichuris suis]KFD66129.1 hypothetical protein M514_02149 [Trichuris suis]
MCFRESSGNSKPFYNVRRFDPRLGRTDKRIALSGQSERYAHNQQRPCCRAPFLPPFSTQRLMQPRVVNQLRIVLALVGGGELQTRRRVVGRFFL